MAAPEHNKEMASAARASFWRSTNGIAVIVAVVAAIASVGGALISWNAASRSTDQEYVSLAMGILADSKSTQPSRNWAIGVISELSPTAVSPELATGLLTGKPVLPKRLDSNATRAEIVQCMKPLLDSEIALPLEGAPLPSRKTLKDWVIFSVEQTGQLERANSRIGTYREIVALCVEGPLGSVEQGRER